MSLSIIPLSDNKIQNCSMKTEQSYKDWSNFLKKPSFDLLKTNNDSTNSSASTFSSVVKPEEHKKNHKFNETELMETIQSERKATLKAACKRLHGMTNKTIINDRLFYSSKYKVRSYTLKLKTNNYKNSVNTYFSSIAFVEQARKLEVSILKNI